MSTSDKFPFSEIFTSSTYNSIWELDSNGDIMPEDAPADEGYFQLDSNGDIEPIS